MVRSLGRSSNQIGDSASCSSPKAANDEIELLYELAMVAACTQLGTEVCAWCFGTLFAPIHQSYSEGTGAAQVHALPT